jgi:DNA-binding helix-hairpin-helix protein with protein kinase domain
LKSRITPSSRRSSICLGKRLIGRKKSPQWSLLVGTNQLHLLLFRLILIFAPNGQFVGFIMRKVGGHKPVHHLYSPASRKTDFIEAGFPFLVQAALNIARAIASAQTTGCVIGDINHSGILISNEATATLIDSDSFQVATSARTFLCQVGVPEFTPPELQGKRLDHVKRTPNHDAFGLAVLIFQLLFMGRHPFSGRFTGTAEMPLQRAISEFRFAYSSNKRATNMEPPPNVPLLPDFPVYVAKAFEKSFGREGANGFRPTAADWVSLLEKLRSELVVCTNNRAHHHYKAAPSCPWCRMEASNPGFFAFGSLQQIRIIPTTVDVNQLISMVAGIRDPGPPPDITSILGPTNITPSDIAVAAARKRWQRFGFGAAAALAGLMLLILGTPPLIGLILIGASIALAIRPLQENEAITTARRNAEALWNSSREMWTRQTGNKRFLEIKDEVSALINSLAGLPGEEQKRGQELGQKKRENQLTQFLDKHHIAHAKIRKISSTRKVTLASYGIETAADVIRHRIEAIHGFGPNLASNLIAWRQSIERRFVYNPQAGLSSADVNSIRSDTLRRRADLEGRIRKSVASLQHAANEIIEQQTRLTTAANVSFRGLKQTQLDEETAAKPPIQINSTVVTSVIAVAAALAMMSYIGFQSQKSPAPPTRPLVPTENRPLSIPQSPTTLTKALPVLPSPKVEPRTPELKPQIQNPIVVGTPIPAPSPALTPAPGTPEPKPQIQDPTVVETPIPALYPAPPGRSPPTLPPITISQTPTSAPRTPEPEPQIQSPIVVGTPIPASGPHSPSLPTLPPRIITSPLPIPVSAPSVTTESTPPPAVLIDLAKSDQAKRVQQRLIELAYLDGTADGVWGLRSRRALREFRTKIAIGNDDIWNEQTQERLFSELAIRSSPASNPITTGPKSSTPIKAVSPPAWPPPGW